MIYNLGNATFSTVFNNSLNPSWNQTIKLKAFKVNGKLPLLILQVYDRDQHSLRKDSHDYMGQCVIELKNENYYDSQENLTEPTCKKWYDLMLNKNVKKGRIYCSFIVLNQ